MKKHVLGLSIVLLALLLAGCNETSTLNSTSSDSADFADKIDVNVAASANGATVTTNFNKQEAGNLIDGDNTTIYGSQEDTPIVVEFEQVESVIEITLSRVNSPATLGSDPDILVELSSDGTNWTTSNISAAIGNGSGVACPNWSFNKTTMKCGMPNGHNVSHIRITSRNSNAFEFTQLEAIAKK